MRIPSHEKLALTLLLAGTLAVGPAFADKPEWAGKGNSGKHSSESRRDDARGGEHDTRTAYFDDHHRSAAREYYDESFRSGHCPPGLAKKHNGCMPPGQARKWRKGYPLPREVVFYNLPPRMLERLGPPPAHHKYVRVAGDILLIAIGSGMVIDAIQDITR